MPSMMIHPYYDPQHGWVFDDPEKELVKEGLVCGIDVILNAVCTSHGLDPLQGFDVEFSDQEIPNADVVLRKIEEINGQPDVFGTNYIDEHSQTQGWLCPNLLQYFESPPEMIYCVVRA